MLVERYHFDCIVLDIALPGKPGLEWLQQLRWSGFYGEVILITAFADIDTAMNALRAGASDLILKPFRLNSLKRCFDRAPLARELRAAPRGAGAFVYRRLRVRPCRR